LLRPDEEVPNGTKIS